MQNRRGLDLQLKTRGDLLTAGEFAAEAVRSSNTSPEEVVQGCRSAADAIKKSKTKLGAARYSALSGTYELLLHCRKSEEGKRSILKHMKHHFRALPKLASPEIEIVCATLSVGRGYGSKIAGCLTFAAERNVPIQKCADFVRSFGGYNRCLKAWKAWEEDDWIGPTAGGEEESDEWDAPLAGEDLVPRRKARVASKAEKRGADGSGRQARNSTTRKRKNTDLAIVQNEVTRRLVQHSGSIGEGKARHLVLQTRLLSGGRMRILEFNFEPRTATRRKDSQSKA